jgi:hypothetical protein
MGFIQATARGEASARATPAGHSMIDIALLIEKHQKLQSARSRRG